MIKQIMAFTGQCDNCKREFEAGNDGWVLFLDNDTVREEMSDHGWHEDGNKHYCDECHRFTDQDKLVINTDRFIEAD